MKHVKLCSLTHGCVASIEIIEVYVCIQEMDHSLCNNYVVLT